MVPVHAIMVRCMSTSFYSGYIFITLELLRPTAPVPQPASVHTRTHAHMRTHTNARPASKQLETDSADADTTTFLHIETSTKSSKRVVMEQPKSFHLPYLLQIVDQSTRTTISTLFRPGLFFKHSLLLFQIPLGPVYYHESEQVKQSIEFAISR